MKFLIPDLKSFQNYFEMMFEDAIVSESSGVLDKATKVSYGYFIDRDDKIVACVIGDWPFIAFSSSALTMIPKGGAEDAAKDGDFSAMMVANYDEICNILSRVFMDNSTPHLRYAKCAYGLENASDELKAFLEDSSVTRKEFKAKIDGYGEGHLQLLAY